MSDQTAFAAPAIHLKLQPPYRLIPEAGTKQELPTTKAIAGTPIHQDVPALPLSIT
jgi:hypothetical protein